MTHCSCDRHTLQQPFLERLAQLGIDAYGNFSESDFKNSLLYDKHPNLLPFLTNCQKTISYPTLDIDTNGHTDNTYTNHEFHIVDPNQEHPILIIRPFDWSDNPILRYVPNFQAIDYDVDITIWWYKYALRGATTEYKLTVQMIHNYFDDLEEKIVDLAKLQ